MLLVGDDPFQFSPLKSCPVQSSPAIVDGPGKIVFSIPDILDHQVARQCVRRNWVITTNNFIPVPFLKIVIFLYRMFWTETLT